jgi:hypothetical protein
MREQATGNWRRLYREEPLLIKYYWGDKIMVGLSVWRV